MSISEILSRHRQRVETQLLEQLSHTSIESSLQDAMRYSLLNGGKRVRPALVYMVNELLGGQVEWADTAACAIECIHSYSLVHDDLPAMDDDDLRRGNPTCHIKFNEATAILAGDALQCFAFELLTGSSHPAEAKVNMIKVLASASGDRGMVAGQAFDLSHVDQALTLEQLEQMHAHKTGALIDAAVELGYLSSGVQDPGVLQSLKRYSQAIGLAFQVQDDILDIEGDTMTLGKPQGSDMEKNKPTYPALLGMQETKRKLDGLHNTAIESLKPFGDLADDLARLADFIVTRTH